MSEKQNDPIKIFKATAFDWVFRALIGIVLWIVLDMHGDLKAVLKVIPVIQNEIDHLKDKSLMERFRSFEMPPPAKHEDIITLDTLRK